LLHARSMLDYAETLTLDCVFLPRSTLNRSNAQIRKFFKISSSLIIAKIAT